jgi:hypothetical protein
MWQQFLIRLALWGAPGEHILEVSVGVMPVHASRLNKAHDGGGTLARAQ